MAHKHRILKLAVLAAAAGAAMYWLRSRKQEHEHTKGPETDTDAAAEAPNTAPACEPDAPADDLPDPESSPAQPAEEPAGPAPEQPEPAPAQDAAPADDAQSDPAPKAPVYRPVKPEGGPNVNPVENFSPAPPVVDGKVDATKIAAPEDFANWDDLGCQG